MIDIKLEVTRERIDYRELRRRIDLFNKRMSELEPLPIRINSDGSVDGVAATNVLRDLGIDNATIVGSPFGWKVEPL